jgi:glycosyltransferase involved in cell wall biosynthesis
MRVAVIIPALDEEASLPLVLRDLGAVPQKGFTLAEVVVVDNGSRDRTAQVAREGGATVVDQPRRGYGSACLAGMAHLLTDPPEILVILDADYSDHPEELPRLLAPVLADEADLVMGERVSRAERGALLPQQRWGNAVATHLIARVGGHRYADMGPFRAVRWSSLERLEMEDATWGWNVEMQLKALQRGLRVLEVPVIYRPRIGRSKISGTVRGTVRAGGRILWAVWHYRES